MSITSMADRKITVKRRTARVIDPAAATATMTPDRQNAVDSLIEVAVTGSPFPAPPFTVTVAGDVGGAPDTEVLSFLTVGTMVTTTRFDAGTLTDFSTSPAAPGLIVEALAVGSDGSREHAAYDVVTGWPARFDRGRAGWPHGIMTVGQEITRFYVDYTTVWAPRRGDVIIDERTGDEWKVYGAPALHSRRTIPHHWEIEVREDDGASAT